MSVRALGQEEQDESQQDGKRWPGRAACEDGGGQAGRRRGGSAVRCGRGKARQGKRWQAMAVAPTRPASSRGSSGRLVIARVGRPSSCASTAALLCPSSPRLAFIHTPSLDTLPSAPIARRSFVVDMSITSATGTCRMEWLIDCSRKHRNCNHAGAALINARYLTATVAPTRRMRRCSSRVPNARLHGRPGCWPRRRQQAVNRPHLAELNCHRSFPRPAGTVDARLAARPPQVGRSNSRQRQDNKATGCCHSMWPSALCWP